MNEITYKEIYEYAEQEISQCLFETFNILNSKYANENKNEIYEIVIDAFHDQLNDKEYYMSLPKVN